MRHASITVALRVAAERGIPLPEVLPATGHPLATPSSARSAEGTNFCRQRLRAWQLVVGYPINRPVSFSRHSLRAKSVDPSHARVGARRAWLRSAGGSGKLCNALGSGTERFIGCDCLSASGARFARLSATETT